jgi:hypothetical protein
MFASCGGGMSLLRAIAFTAVCWGGAFAATWAVVQVFAERGM